MLCYYRYDRVTAEMTEGQRKQERREETEQHTQKAGEGYGHRAWGGGQEEGKDREGRDKAGDDGDLAEKMGDIHSNLCSGCEASKTTRIVRVNILCCCTLLWHHTCVVILLLMLRPHSSLL